MSGKYHAPDPRAYVSSRTAPGPPDGTMNPFGNITWSSGAPAAAALCQTFRKHPRWALVESAPVMTEVWKRVAQPRVARRRVFDARLALTLRHHGVREFATDNVREFDGFGVDKVWSPVRR